ncbi:hypothetical protein CONPUDRAFT_161390 [Coniophora puteana RWD-64-598 SS2]|uniref:J domain-containing protein n=1 Tax=Coniophora puteana (strain RWD-64-598) TaxID=741705 RepID=A0A5M3N5M5_CONPW|nr:uncharacterized protein CONPUDRAFT_161390 [Coniophora puteana RWD-64-598 SS2]EIW86709.1 hypothetical protein CONPUDRAFT_161390 [Coniophora puteana RWD-64-598 SS2]
MSHWTYHQPNPPPPSDPGASSEFTSFSSPIVITKSPVVLESIVLYLARVALLPTSLPVCPKCNFIASVDRSIPYHHVLGLPYDPNPFSVDTSLLKRRYHAAQRLCHPDAWATKSENERETALDLSNVVNAAYNSLLSPLQRAEYILFRNGREVGEADQLQDMELIEEIMEMREEIESCQASNAERLHTLREMNNAKIQETGKVIEDLVQKQAWDALHTAAVRLKYLQGIEDAVKQRLDQF